MSAIPKGMDYSKGYTTGRVEILRSVAEQLRENPEIRTVVAAAEYVNNRLEDAERLRDEIYGYNDTPRKESHGKNNPTNK